MQLAAVESPEAGQYYTAIDPYGANVIVVRVDGKSASVENHWSCTTPEGRKKLIPSDALIRRTFGFK
jgi:imidazole glycerol phosphate synthase subunit HisF